MTLIPGIKQISQVGNDMYAQGAITIAGIGTAEVSYLADPADTRLLAGRDPVLEEVSVGMSGVETDMKYATGAQPLTVTDAMLGNLTYCQVQFSPKQDLNGYANPWPAGGGKNKFFHGTELSGQYIQQTGIVATADGWMVSDYIPVLPNTQYTFNPNSSSGASAYAAFYNENKSKKGSTIPSGKQTFTTYEDTAYMRFSFRATSEDIQLELGATDTAFVPYENICPITGTTAVNVYVAESYDPTAASEATISLGAERFGGTADLVSGIGSDGWSTYDSYQITTVGTSSQGVAYARLTAPSDAKSNGIVKAECYANTDGESTNNACRFAGGSLYVYDNRFADATTATTLLSGISFVYEVATPTPYTFPGANDITLQDGTNTIWADTNGTDISVTYVTKK